MTETEDGGGSGAGGVASSIAGRRIAAGLLAYLVATIHLFHPSHGARRLVRVLTLNPAALVTDPRPLLFTVSGLALVAGVFLALRGLPERPILGGGVALMVTYVVGYFGWHLSGHGGFLPNRKPLYHDYTPVEAVITHLSSDPFALVSIVAEVALLVLLVLLLREAAAE